LDLVSWGAGVESSAYFTEILINPARRDVAPQNLVVLHAVVGSEFTDTLTLSQRFILPLLADRGVRLVQLSRRGRHEQHVGEATTEADPGASRGASRVPSTGGAVGRANPDGLRR